ncbi:MAG TPA: APC family permease [Bryobacteraceae bacterium]|nr:APC family permease [Bryobacteraceae bacterium]
METPASEAVAQGAFRPVLSLWALVLFGLAFVGPTAPYAFFGVGSVKSHGHFALVYLIAMFAISFTAVSYGRMAAAFPEAGSTYAYASRALHPVAGYLAGWVMILDYLLMPMLCVIVAAVTSNKLVPAVPYFVWVLFTAATITGINLCGIEMTSRATIIFNTVLAVSIVWFVAAAARALLGGTGEGTLVSLKPFYNASNFSLAAVMSATPIAVLSFLGFDGISTLAEDAKDPEKNVARATVLVCFVAGVVFILQTYLGQLIWSDYTRFSPIEAAFSDIGRLIGGTSLFYFIAFLVIAQAWASGITSQASASRLLFGMARDGRLPPRLFGYVHPVLRTPIYSLLLMGSIAALGALLLDLDQAAEVVNFGACLGFMVVNLSVLGLYFVRRRERRASQLWANIICPVAGFVICFYIWLSISLLAMRLGALWTIAGLVYLAVQTGGFRKNISA